MLNISISLVSKSADLSLIAVHKLLARPLHYFKLISRGFGVLGFWGFGALALAYAW